MGYANKQTAHALFDVASVDDRWYLPVDSISMFRQGLEKWQNAQETMAEKEQACERKKKRKTNSEMDEQPDETADRTTGTPRWCALGLRAAHTQVDLILSLPPPQFSFATASINCLMQSHQSLSSPLMSAAQLSVTSNC